MKKTVMTLWVGTLIACIIAPVVVQAEDKITVTNPSTGTIQFRVNTEGGITANSLGVGVAADRPFVLDTSSNNLAAGNSSFIVQGSSNKERMELRSFGAPGFFAPTFMGMAGRGTMAAPLPVGANDLLFLLSGFGWNGTAFGGSNPAGNSGAASVIMYASETHSTTAKGSHIDFQTTANGTTTRATKLRINNNGNIGIGTTTPAQKLEVNGGIRINTATAMPACDSTSRGTFWVSQGVTDDTVQVCVLTGSTLAWRTVNLAP